MASRDYICDECTHHFRTPPSETRDSPFVMCPACGSGFVSLDIEPRRRPTVMRASDMPRAGDWWLRVHEPKVS
jgi:DNA-directed RNA polymerase subunit RPC12/RpoP